MLSCQNGYELVSQEMNVTTKCLRGGVWSVPIVPACRPRYCGPAPRFANALPVDVTSFDYEGIITYRCLEGYRFQSGANNMTITCEINGKWSSLTDCLPVNCQSLNLKSLDLSHIQAKILTGDGLSYG